MSFFAQMALSALYGQGPMFPLFTSMYEVNFQGLCRQYGTSNKILPIIEVVHRMILSNFLK